MQTYTTFQEFLKDISRDERVTGHNRGNIVDTITRQLLGRWESVGNTVQVRWV